MMTYEAVEVAREFLRLARDRRAGRRVDEHAPK